MMIRTSAIRTGLAGLLATVTLTVVGGAAAARGDIGFREEGEPLEELELEFQPDVWNVNWEGSSGTVSALLMGEGAAYVDLDSIELEGPAGTLAPQSVAMNGPRRARARFDKAEAFALLDGAGPGETFDLTVHYVMDDQPFTATASIRTVGPSDDGGGDDGEDDGGGGESEGTAGDYRIEIQPDHWNLNWDRSSGQVSLKIQGPALWKIDLDSIVLVGETGEEVEAKRADRHGNHIRAVFAKHRAIEILDDPDAGETHEVTVRMTAAGETLEGVVSVAIVGKGGDDGPGDDGPGGGGTSDEYHAVVQPATWNVNWNRNSGQVSVKIQGPSLGDVDLDSIVLVGETGDELEAKRARRQGNHVRAVFAMHLAIELLDDPDRGETHQVLLRFEADGETVEIALDVRVVGP